MELKIKLETSQSVSERQRADLHAAMLISRSHCFEQIRYYMMLKVILAEFDTKNEDGNEVIIPAEKVVRTVVLLT